MRNSVVQTNSDSLTLNVV